MILNFKEIFIIMIGLYVAFSFGSFLKLLKFRINILVTLLISFFIPFLLIKVTANSTYRVINQKGIKQGIENIKDSVMTYPLHVGVTGEMFAEIYAKQIAKRRVLKKYNINPTSQTVSFGTVTSSYMFFRELLNNLSKNMIDDKHNIFKIY